MPITARIEATGTVYIRASGLVTYEDLRNFVWETRARPALGSPQLFDARGAQTDLTVEQIRGLQNTVRDQFERGEIGPTAIVASAGSVFGLDPMTQSYTVGHAVQVRVFCEIASAEAWLSSLDADRE
jgi:hypothetical protein